MNWCPRMLGVEVLFPTSANWCGLGKLKRYVRFQILLPQRAQYGFFVGHFYLPFSSCQKPFESKFVSESRFYVRTQHGGPMCFSRKLAFMVIFSFRYSSHVADALPDGTVVVATNQANDSKTTLHLYFNACENLSRL